jgi:hypothetical protein
MDARTGERRASSRDREYTPHEYEELRALAKKTRERLRPATPPNQANGHKPKLA